jgi:predicted AlkP superfamily phosphohydrolase/phosphomutase/Tfp pilus assembly protein PilF
MFRSRLVRTLLTLFAIAVVSYALVSLFLPSSRRLILGVDKRTGEVRLVQSRVTFLPPHRFYQLVFERREGAAQRDGVVRISSQEGVPVTIAYRLRFEIEGQRLPDSRTLVREGWSAWIRTRVGEAVSEVTRRVPIEELLSPTSQFTARRDLLRNTVAAHLARSGLKVTAFELSRVEADRDALLAYKRAELRRGARGVAGRVAIFAIDGADWELLSELSDDDRIPNIRALVRGGTTANLQTIQPTVSPLVWTTMATGHTPDRHGVIDYQDRNTRTPVDAASRHTPALWDVAEAFGRHAVVVNWWTAWPATGSSATTVYDTPVQLLSNAIYPSELAAQTNPLVVAPETLGYGQVRRFLNITDAEYQRGLADPRDPVNVFRDTLAKTWTDHRVAISLYQQQAPLLMMMGYGGTDVVNHLFAPYHPPYREGISQENYRRYWPAVANYYSEIDRLIGEWMSVLSDDTTVILVSAHGFRWGKTNRPRQSPAGRAAVSDHRNTGIFVAYGNHVAPSRAGHPMSIYDVAPAVLSILGLPKSTDMPGNVPPWMFRDITPVESVRVVSYGEFFQHRPVPGLPRADRARYEQQLQAVGHLIDPTKPQQPVFDEDDDVRSATTDPVAPGQFGSYAWYNNQGIDQRSKGKLREAVESFQKAIEIYPSRPTAYLNLAMTLFDRQQYTAADEAFIQAVQHGLPNAERWFIDFAALYRDRNMTSRAITLLYAGKKIFPQSYAIAANLGSALAQSDRYTEGLPELERALGLQPSSTTALNNLGVYYAKQKDFGRALDFWNRSLTIDPRQPQIRGAADAARTQL